MVVDIAGVPVVLSVLGIKRIRQKQNEYCLHTELEWKAMRNRQCESCKGDGMNKAYGKRLLAGAIMEDWRWVWPL